MNLNRDSNLVSPDHSLALLPIELSKFPFQFMLKRSSRNDKCQTLSLFRCKELKSQALLSFQEKRLNTNWNGNSDSSIDKSARLVIWRSDVWILVQVWIFLLKSKLEILYEVWFFIIVNIDTALLQTQNNFPEVSTLNIPLF